MQYTPRWMILCFVFYLGISTNFTNNASMIRTVNLKGAKFLKIPLKKCKKAQKKSHHSILLSFHQQNTTFVSHSIGHFYELSQECISRTGIYTVFLTWKIQISSKKISNYPLITIKNRSKHKIKIQTQRFSNTLKYASTDRKKKRTKNGNPHQKKLKKIFVLKH